MSLQIILYGVTQVGLAHFWKNPFLIPVYLSLSLLVGQVLIVLFQRIRNPFGPREAASLSSSHSIPVAQARRFDEAKSYIQTQKASTTFLKIFRLLGTLALTGLTVVALVTVEENDQSFLTAIDIAEKESAKRTHERYRRNDPQATLTQDEWIEIIYLGLYSYASLLALMTIVSKRRWSSTANTHLILIMLAVFAVYTYRDLYPLATFTLNPKDGAQGWLLWSRIGIVSLVAVFVPLFTPRIYTPVDPLNPAKEVNTEQTASWASFLTFTFLDPIIWRAAWTPHLPYDSLPPMADYDRAEYLVGKSKQILDPFLRQKRTHLFWGLMHFFAWEYMWLTAMVILRVFTSFMAPLGINRLLTYLETGGEHAVVRPWVWILWLFLGPNLGSLAMQYYIFLATRTLVRTECILTQLVFDHALRIRMNEEAEPNSLPAMVATAATTPETQSISEGRTENADSEEDTLQGSSGPSSVQTSAGSIAKGKATANAGVTSTSISISAAAPGPDGARIKTGTKGKNLAGKINNCVSTDLGNITDGRDFILIGLSGPLQLLACVWFLYAVLDWSALVGLGVMAVSTPLPGYVAKLINKVQTERMKKTDARVQAVTEVLSVIHMTKLFGWEQKVNAQVAEKRETELRWLKKRKLLNLLNSILSFFFPILTMLVTFATYTIVQREELTASKVFSSMAVFDMLQNVLNSTVFRFPTVINAKVSLGRINDFLLNTELLDRFAHKGSNTEPEINPSQNIDSDAIGFRDATFSWGRTLGEVQDAPPGRRFRLSIEGDLFFQPHKLNLVIGPTGSGKTSLLMALLGEMHFEPNGESAGFNLPRDDGVAYAAQEAWENILFGKPYDQERYDKVIFQCGLERDLSLFEGGDSTEVGEKGLTLSGGQKVRITLARAVYSDAKILLLDDILAALDVHTAKFVVEKCLQGDLLRGQGRTTILVTHNVGMVMPIADFVVSLGLDGRIASRGTVSDALVKDAKLLEEVTEMNEVIEKAQESVDGLDPAKEQHAAAKLVVAEEIALGHVDWGTLKLYFSGLGGWIFWSSFLTCMLLSELLTNAATWFLGYWSSQYGRRGDHPPGWVVPVTYYLLVYSLIMSAVTVLYSVALAIFLFGSIRACRTIHMKLITSVLGTTLRWLDTVPTARIIARCTQDIRAVDGPINQTLSTMVDLTNALIIKCAAVILFVPFFALPGIAVFIVGGLCGQLYIKAQLSIKREMSNRRSPVLAHFGAAIAGLTSLRAYGAQAAFRAESMKRIDEYTRPARAFYNCNRWICIRIDAIGGIFAAGLAAYLVYGKDLYTPSNTGFSLTMAVEFSGMILWWVRILNEFEVQGNSLERIEGYVNIEQEPKATKAGVPPAYWPASGAITVENLCARYSVDGPEVLHNISFEINSGERIGVVGRTGSGKSSLTLSLLRCIPTEGRVIFDGLRTDSINLDALRSSITIIPQQPELMSGTLRENLDPFSEHSDATLNDALRAAGLFNLQRENDMSMITLDSSVSSGGNNLSVGQRQILALARAIVRQSKLLILDEATSAIDYATDSIIQNTLREVLQDATLITVAHRLQTIMDADKIMVLDAGRMVEYDSPVSLLKKGSGYLKSLVDESGDRDILYGMAEKASRSEG